MLQKGNVQAEQRYTLQCGFSRRLGGRRKIEEDIQLIHYKVVRCYVLGWTENITYLNDIRSMKILK